MGANKHSISLHASNTNTGSENSEVPALLYRECMATAMHDGGMLLGALNDISEALFYMLHLYQQARSSKRNSMYRQVNTHPISPHLYAACDRHGTGKVVDKNNISTYIQCLTHVHIYPDSHYVLLHNLCYLLMNVLDCLSCM